MEKNEENEIENRNEILKINCDVKSTDNSKLGKNDEINREKKEEGISREDFKDKNNINENKENESLKVEFSYYAIVIVIIFFLLNFVNGMHWVTFASCAAKFGKFYNLNNLEVDILSLVFMALYLFTSYPCSWIIDKKSMRWGLNISAILIIIGALLKIFINTSIAFAYIGQIFTALFQPAILNSPAKLSATWFNEKWRVLITSICCSSNTIGVMFGYIVHTFVIEENIEDPKTFKDDFKSYLTLEFIISIVFCVIFIIFMREKPKYPPSNSQINRVINENKSTFEEVKKLFSIKNFIYLFISLSCIVGYVNIIATIFNSYMDMYDITDTQASYISGIANFLGIITSIIVAAIIDKNKKFTIILLLCNILSIVLYLITIIVLELVKSKYLYIIIGILFSLLIGVAIPIYTSGMDLVCEITYPIGESTSDGVIMVGNQFIGIIGIIITALLRTHLENVKVLSNIFCILLFLISLICLFFLHRAKPELKRSKQDENNNQ